MLNGLLRITLRFSSGKDCYGRALGHHDWNIYLLSKPLSSVALSFDGVWLENGVPVELDA